MPQDISANSKRIAKNTLFLYFRMLLTMAITLYTSRIVLKQLGVDDFGIYNVVGGIVSMFSIISASLTSSISRFLTFEIGKGSTDYLKVVFSTSITIQFFLALVIVFLVETVGIWFLNYRMTIAPERLYAANWVLQCSMVTFVINMLSVPYNAAIIAHEKMQAFAYVSILEVSLKLGVAFMLYIDFFDTLIMYAILIMLISLVIRLVYGVYCDRHFTECHLERKFDKGLLSRMLSYSGWNFIGSSSAILRDQGGNILINLFCGTAVNAARGIAMQVHHAVNGFSHNFMLAVNPQIIKSYASGERSYMMNLAFKSSRFSYYLLFCLSLPLLIAMPRILSVWLTVVPPYTVDFARLILIFGMSETISLPLQYMNQATGKIMVYQLTVGGLQMLNFPLAYLLLKCGFSPVSVFILSIVISQVCLSARLLILRRTIGLSIKSFMKNVYLRILSVTFMGISFPLLYTRTVASTSIACEVLGCTLSLVMALVSIYLIGCDDEEKKFVSDRIVSLFFKFKH